MLNSDKDNKFVVDLSENWCLEIVQMLPFEVILIDKFNKIVNLNPKALNTFGNIDVQSEIDKVIAQFNEELIQVEDGSKELSIETDMLTNNGPKYFKIKITIVDNIQDGFDGRIITLNDVTEYRIEIDNLKKENESVENDNKTKSDFLSNISHEIRTSVNGIIGMTDLTLMTNLKSDQRENLSLVKSSALNLLDMTNSILDFSKIQAGKMKIENTEFNFKELIDETVRLSTIKALEYKLEFKAKVDESIPDTLTGDSVRIKQILDSLIDNSIKFTKYGTIALIIEKLESIDKKVNLKISVKDTGIGIDRKDIPKLFKGFSQIDNKDYTKKSLGTGLGLCICKGLVEMMGGKIEVRSRKDVGSVFSFNILLEKGKKYSSTINDKKPKVLGNSAIDRRLNILIVEDDKASQMVIYNLFKKNGHICEIADNGQEALNLLENKQYDLVFMDIQMPVLDGLQATKIIRKSEENSNRHTPIIALTAYALKEDKEKFLSAGMDNYISKPFNMNELLKVVNNTIKKDDSSNTIFGKNQNDIDGDSLFLYLL